VPEYLSPGVYVEEVDRGPRPIQGVSTATAAFVGFTEKAQLNQRVDGEVVITDLTNRPQLITNWSQFREHYGDFVEGAYLPHAVYGYLMNGGSRCYVLSVKTIPKAQAGLLGSDGKPYLIARAKQAGFDGLRLRVIIEGGNGSSPAPSSSAKKGSSKSDDKEEDDKSSGSSSSSSSSQEPFTLTVEREKTTGGWQVKEVLSNVTLVEVTTDDGKEVRVAYQNNKKPQWIDLIVPDIKATLAKMWPREQQQSLQIDKAQLTAPDSSDFQGDVSERTGVEGLEALDDVTMLCVPDLMTPMPGQELDLDMVRAVQNMMIGHCQRLGDRVAILDAPPNLSPQDIRKWRMDVAGFDSSYAALYYPWITVRDPLQKRNVSLPPSGHVAGIWARTDTQRGVHKAPANEVIGGATGLEYNLTKGEQDILNPIGVNCLRAFPGRGIRVWGARTLSSDPAWRYINVRRLFNFVEKSIEQGTQWVVFEPNDRTLWARVKRDVTAFLKEVFRTGALFGNTPGEAFYVKCDDELNPPESRDLGRLVIEVGLSPVKPAEFVIFRISQWAGVGGEEEGGEAEGGEG